MDEVVKDVRNDKKLVQYVRKNMDFIGEEYIERDLTQGIGSTDVGNVTHEIPAIQFLIITHIFATKIKHVAKN